MIDDSKRLLMINEFEKQFNEKLDQFIEWRKGKGFIDFGDILKLKGTNQVELQFWSDMKEFELNG